MESMVEENKDKPIKKVENKKKTNAKPRVRKTVKKTEQNKVVKANQENERFKKMNIDQELPTYLL